VSRTTLTAGHASNGGHGSHGSHGIPWATFDAASTRVPGASPQLYYNTGVEVLCCARMPVQGVTEGRPGGGRTHRRVQSQYSGWCIDLTKATVGGLKDMVWAKAFPEADAPPAEALVLVDVTTGHDVDDIQQLVDDHLYVVKPVRCMQPAPATALLGSGGPKKRHREPEPEPDAAPSNAPRGGGGGAGGGTFKRILFSNDAHPGTE